MSGRRVSWWLACIATTVSALGVGIVALWLLSGAEQFAVAGKIERIDRQLQRELAGALARADERTVARAVQRLGGDPSLHLIYLAVSGRDGRLVAQTGRDERWRLPGMPVAATRLLGLLGYRWTGPFQHLELHDPDSAVAVGTAEFIVEGGVTGARGNPVVRHLGWAGLAALALAILNAVAAVLVWRRFLTLPAPWTERLMPDPKAPAVAAPIDLEERVHEQLPLRLGAWLDELERGLIVVDEEACIRYLNQTARQLTGWGATDVQGRLLYSVFHPLDARYSPMLTPAEICMRDGRPYAPAELRLRARDGVQRAIEAMALPLRKPGGAADGALMLFHDISEREKRVEQWRRQARVSQSVVDHLSEGVLTTDPVGVIRFANARALRLFGYAWEDIEGASITKLMPVPFLNSPSVRLTDYIGADRSVALPKVVGWRKDATTFPAELLVQNMTIDHAQGLLVIVRDVSERLRSDNLAQRLGRLLDAASEEVYIFDANTLRFVEVNRGARRNLGYHASEMTHLTTLAISEQLDEATFMGYLESLRSGAAEHRTYRCLHRRADGSRYPVEVRLNYSREEEPPVFMAIAVDITGREDAERPRRKQGTGGGAAAGPPASGR